MKFPVLGIEIYDRYRIYISSTILKIVIELEKEPTYKLVRSLERQTVFNDNLVSKLKIKAPSFLFHNYIVESSPYDKN